jgi:hypothetical protein
MDTPELVSLQVGVVRDLGRVGAPRIMDRPWTSAIVKERVAGRRHVGLLGVDGDEQADLVSHGGADKALLAYGAENLARWEAVLGELPPGGGFGENLTIRDLDETRSASVIATASAPRCSSAASRASRAGSSGAGGGAPTCPST